MKDYYQILELTFDSDGEAIKRAYRKLALKYHPDQNGGASSQEKFIEITEAYEMLRDDHKRRVYNAMYTSYFMNRARGVQEDPGNGNGAFQHAQNKAQNQAYQYTQNTKKEPESQGPFRHNAYSYTTTQKAPNYKTYKKPSSSSSHIARKSTIHTKYWGILGSMLILTLAGLVAVLFTTLATRNAWFANQELVFSQNMAFNGLIFLVGVVFQYKGLSLFMRYMYDYRRALRPPVK